MLKRLIPLIFLLLTLLYITKGIWAPKEKEKTVNVGTGFQFPVSVSAVRYGGLKEVVRLPADIKASSEVDVIPTFLGRIEKFYIKEGDAVNAGDKLLKYAGPAEDSPDFFDDLIVKAPISGVITAVLKDAGMNAEEDKPILTVSSIDIVRAVVNLPSEYNAMLSSGMKARIEVDAIPGETFTGTLKTVRPQVDPVSRTSYVEFLIANKGHSLLPGMAGTVSFTAGTSREGSIVPMVSIFVENERSYVYINAKDKAVRRPITVLQEGVDEAVILGDLRAGTQVLTTRPDSLKNGDAIYVVK
jgi:membrane fusion protein (multidrug efflux system)